MSTEDDRTERQRMFLAYLKREIASHRNYIDEFAKRLTARDRLGNGAGVPAFLLGSGETLFQAAAILKIFSEVHEALTAPDTKATFEYIRDYASIQALQKARHPSRSTSAMSNLLDESEMSVWAQLADKMGWYD